MLRPRSPRYPALSAYLQARQSFVLPRKPNQVGLGIAAFFALLIGLTSLDTLSPTSFLLIAMGSIAGFVFFRSQRRLPPSAEERIAQKASEVVRQLWPYAVGNRLHRALHPGVGAVLEECAGYHARILNALDEWHASDLRESARTAAQVAMDEALVHAGATLSTAPPPSPLESISDALESVGFGPLLRGERVQEPMPTAFRPVRELAERLRELAVRCEASSSERREAEPEAVSAAFRHLDATLGEMRQREAAESELRQGA